MHTIQFPSKVKAAHMTDNIVFTRTTRSRRGSVVKSGLRAVAALLIATLVAGPDPATAATSNTPVWIGAGFAGSYRDGTRPGQHGGNQVAFDYYGSAGTTVRIYAAPKNTAYNNQITTHIIASGAGSGDAARCGYYAVVEVRHSGNPIGRVTFSHLAAKAAIGQMARWGGQVGTIANLPLNSGAACYQVKYASGRHSHIEFRNYGSRPACGQDWGVTSIPETRYQGYVGDYGKAPLSGNRCPSGI